MNKTEIEWVKNPDGSQGYAWNPITGCLNGCEYCYARKLANGRLKSRYLANENIPKPSYVQMPFYHKFLRDPFHPRFWEDKLGGITPKKGRHLFPPRKARGIFVCDMSDLFGIGIPEDWTRRVLQAINRDFYSGDRFYLLTKQPQNLIKFSPFPDNCWVGVTATNTEMLLQACSNLEYPVEAKLKYLSIEPFLDWSFYWNESYLINAFKRAGIKWVIIGPQTKPYKPPKIKWVQEIIEACDKAGVPVFLKNNLKPLFADERYRIFYPEWAVNSIKSDWNLRQELPA